MRKAIKAEKWAIELSLKTIPNLLKRPEERLLWSTAHSVGLTEGARRERRGWLAKFKRKREDFRRMVSVYPNYQYVVNFIDTHLLASRAKRKGSK